MTASKAFLHELRQALHHLYEPAHLRKSPLLGLFDLTPQDGPLALQRVLLDAIKALRPEASIPPQAKPWRAYSTLRHLYIEQFSQGEVAAALAISTRQLRRQELIASHTLADYLWVRHNLQSTVGDEWPGAEPEGGVGSEESGAPSREQELAWVERSYPPEPVDVAEVLRAVFATMAPLQVGLHVRAELHIPADLPRVTVQLATMRQALLNVLIAAVRSAPGGGEEIVAIVHGAEVAIVIRAVRPRPPAAGQADDFRESLEMARRLVALSGGALQVEVGEDALHPFYARLGLPAAEQVAVLVIDDNADTLQLFQRYLVGSRYAFVGTREPQEALLLAEKLAPYIVVLDVMLPGVDGWELLGHLREHPRTHNVPVIICTIMPEEQEGAIPLRPIWKLHCSFED